METTNEDTSKTSADHDKDLMEAEKYKTKIRIAVKNLNSSSSKQVLKAINYIRVKIIEQNDDVRLLYECGGFKYLFTILTTSQIDVLNATLSLLGNCCHKYITYDEVCRELISNSVAGKLQGLMRKHTDTELLRRLCRLVGNLAHSRLIAQEMHKVPLPAALIHVLDSTEDTDVQIMAVRALRWLWVYEKGHNEMLKLGSVKCVSSFLNTDDYQLLKMVLRTLIVFTQSCNGIIALQLCGKNNNGYELIVSKLVSRPVASVLVCNLSRCPYGRIELSKTNIISVISRAISVNGEKNLDSYLITSLCYMCQESMIRASIRNTDGFRTILALLMNHKAKQYHPELLFAVKQFMYDEASLMLMVKGGLISILLNLLREHTREYGALHTYVRTTRGHSTYERNETVPITQLPSPTSQYTFTPPGSPPSLSDDLDSNGLLYSPRCDPSDTEDELPPVSFISTPRSSSTEERWPDFGSTGIDCILDILCQLNYQRSPLKALGSRDAVDALLDYLVLTRFSQNKQNYLKAVRALISIVTCKQYFNNLLEEECVIEIDRKLNRLRHFDCFECLRTRGTGRFILEQMAGPAQSGLGEGEITYKLASSSHTLSVTTALSVPHVIRQPSMLNTLLFGHGGLKCLLDSLNTRSEDAVPSLHSLFVSLDVKNPKVPEQICTSCEVSAVRHETNITFVTDDGLSVGANKESLEHASVVFEGMFRGGFKESNLSTINLPDITSQSLQYLVRIISSGEFCTCLLPQEIELLLEIIVQADRFLVPDLTPKIISHIMNNILSPDTSLQIFKWFFEIGSNLPNIPYIPTDVVKYLFSTDNMLATNRQLAVIEFIHSKLKHLFLKEITEIVQKAVALYLKSYRHERVPPRFLLSLTKGR